MHRGAILASLWFQILISKLVLRIPYHLIRQSGLHWEMIASASPGVLGSQHEVIVPTVEAVSSWGDLPARFSVPNIGAMPGNIYCLSENMTQNTVKTEG